jgi:hypothetical protein
VTLAIMDALGVQGVLFDEYQRTDGDGAAQPGYRLADGTYRPIGPNAESAALRHATVGTILGPHVMRDVARPARLRTSCTPIPDATTSENVPPLFTGGQVGEPGFESWAVDSGLVTDVALPVPQARGDE